MEKSKQNRFHQDVNVESINVIVENWIPLLFQMEGIQKNINQIYSEIDSLKGEIDRANIDSNTPNTNIFSQVNSDRQLSQAELDQKMQLLLKNLESELSRLPHLKTKINNLMAQKESIEALQEQLTKNCVPSYAVEFETESSNYAQKFQRLVTLKKAEKGQKNRQKFQNIKQKAVNFLSKNVVLSLGLGISAIIGYSMLSNHKYTENTEPQVGVNIDRVETQNF